MSTFCLHSYHRKCQGRGVGGQKSQHLVNVVCEQPLFKKYFPVPFKQLCCIVSKIINWNIITILCSIAKWYPFFPTGTDLFQFSSCEGIRPRQGKPTELSRSVSKNGLDKNVLLFFHFLLAKNKGRWMWPHRGLEAKSRFLWHMWWPRPMQWQRSYRLRHSDPNQ